MEIITSVEQYFMYEVVATLSKIAEWLKGGNRNQLEWKLQLNKLKRAFHLFMLEAKIEDYKDLKLPSEERPKVSSKKDGTSEKSSRGATKVARVARQLPLFFIRKLKKSILRILLFTERTVLSMAPTFLKKHDDFENRLK